MRRLPSRVKSAAKFSDTLTSLVAYDSRRLAHSGDGASGHHDGVLEDGRPMFGSTASITTSTERPATASSVPTVINSVSDDASKAVARHVVICRELCSALWVRVLQVGCRDPPGARGRWDGPSMGL